MGPRGRDSSVGVGQGSVVRSDTPPAGGSAGSQGPVLQFFTKLRRHASLEGASPYFKIKKWKLDSSQRASSLDTRGNGSIMVQSVFLLQYFLKTTGASAAGKSLRFCLSRTVRHLLPRYIVNIYQWLHQKTEMPYCC